MAPNKLYEQISRDRYLILRERCDKFIANVTNPDAEVIKVFDPLGPKLMEELQLIREISQELQNKKEEDIKKAAQAAEEESKAAAEAEAKAAEEAKEAKEGEEKEAEQESTETTEKVEN